MSTQPYQSFQPERSRRPDRTVQAATAFVAAALFFVLGFVEWHDTYVLKDRGEVVNATVDDVGLGRQARITVSYTTREGEPVTAKTRHYSTTRPAVGDTIRVVYDPHKPSRIQVADGLGYVATYILVGMGVLVCLVALVLALWRGGPSNQAPPEVSPYPW